MVDEQLNFILGHTEIYCSHLTKRFHGPKDDKTNDEKKENEEESGKDVEVKKEIELEKEKSIKEEGQSPSTAPVRRSSRKRSAFDDSTQPNEGPPLKKEKLGEEFVPEGDDRDDEETLNEEEKNEKVDHKSEIEQLQKENEMSIEELKKLYGFGNTQPVNEEITSNVDADEDDNKENVEEEFGTSCLVQGSNEENKKEEASDDEMLNSKSKQAMDLHPTGYTLATTQVKTTIPHLLRGTLREYQHVGLNWLVTLYNEKLNGILADEMGLGKTIQTISLLAHLACEKGVWGPHLVVVPTSVILNWEMEFKKWCPAFKILTYYGTQKERKDKRTGWSKSNAFHVCITSYKLVVQDHACFRR